MSDTGFTGEDRETLITVKVNLANTVTLLTGLTERIALIEKEYVHREQMRQVEIDIDELRAAKADKIDLRHLESSKSSSFDQLTGRLERMRHDVEMLVRWRWFERGTIAAIFIAGELYLRFK